MAKKLWEYKIAIRKKLEGGKKLGGKMEKGDPVIIKKRILIIVQAGTVDQKEAIRSAAKAAGMSISAWMMKAAMQRLGGSNVK